MDSMLTFVEVAVVLFVAYSVLGWALYFMQSSSLYKPRHEVTYTPDELGLDFEDVTFEAEDGVRLNGWFVPSQGAEFTVLFCHGNGGNIMHRLDSINIFYNLQINCFIFDYRGYGNSEGKLSEEGTYRDVEAAYRWLTEEKGQLPENIILFGKSLGGSIAAYLAGRVEVASLVLESAFTSYVDIGKEFYPYMPVRLFARFNYDTLSYIKKVHRPVMIIHSKNDEMVSFKFGRELYQAANDPSKFVEIFGHHNDSFLVSGNIYKKAWTEWIKFLKKSREQSDSQKAS